MIAYSNIVNMFLSYMMAFCSYLRWFVGIAKSEKELANKTARFLKAELKRAGVTYADLAKKLEAQGLQETEASISSKLARGTFAATFLLGTIAALEMEGVRLEDL